MNQSIYNMSERFEVAFNQVQDSLEDMLNINNRGFTDLVRIGSTRHKMINKYADELYQYAKLRNAIVHDKVELGYYIAEPHEKVVKRIEFIAKVLSQPNYVLSIATKKVVSYQLDDLMTKVIQEMKLHNFSKYPIYNGKECVGLLKSRTIVKWLAEHMHNDTFQLSQVKVGDIFAYEKEQPIIFVPKQYNIFEVEDEFEKAHSKRKQIEMAVITENGHRDEAPLGVITAWDLIEIDYTTD